MAKAKGTTLIGCVQYLRKHRDAAQFALPEPLHAYLQSSLSMFLLQHQKIDELLEGAIQADPLTSMTTLAEETLRHWISLNKELLRAVASNSEERPPADPPTAVKQHG